MPTNNSCDFGTGTSGQVLTSNGAGVAPTFQAAPASGITTIDGDSGSVTGSTVTIKAGATAGSSVSFTCSGTTISLNDTDANNNVIIGSSGGNASISGTSNTGLGFATLNGLTSGIDNIGIGYASIDGLKTGSYNVAIGTNAGTSYTTSESSNILFNSTGTAAESNVFRVGAGTGTSAQYINKAFINGIAGVTASNPSVTTINTSTGQLGNDTSNFTILSTGLQLKGNNTNTNAPTGFIGENVQSAVGLTSVTTTATNQNLTSISLTAGLWQVAAGVYFQSGGVAGTQFQAGINTTTVNLGTLGDNYYNLTFTALNASVFVPQKYFNLSGTTTVYLVISATFASSMSAAGRISAVRVG